MKIRLALLLTLSSICNTIFAQQDTAFESLLRNIPVWMAQNHVPCMGLGLIKDGHIKYLKTFGELQQGHPAPDNTLFNIASQTKPVTAMLTMRLVQAGLWNLDEPLAHYWIDPDIAASPYLDKLTTRIVLSHQTGFPNWRTDNGGTALRFNFEPGTQFGYSGEGFEYLRRALEARFHLPLNLLLTTYLFKPLGMSNTQYWTADLNAKRFAQWHDGQGRRYNVSIQTPVNAADDLITTAEDYCKLGIATMNGLGLSDTLFADMTRGQVKVKDNYYRCLGWGLVAGLSNGEYALEHGGSDIGVRTMAVFLPKSKSGVVIMTNGDNGMFVIDQVIKRLLADGAQLQATMNKGAGVHQRVTVPDAVIKRHTGVYIQSNGKVFSIEQEGNAIKVSGDGAPTAVLLPESDTSFFMEGYDVQLRFPDDQSLVVYEGGRQVMKINRRQDKPALIDSVSLKNDMYGIASDSTEGRFTASAGYLIAARYVAARLKAAGIQPGWTEKGRKTYLQPVPFTWDDYSGSILTINGQGHLHNAESFIVLQRGASQKGKWVVASSAATVEGRPAGIILLPTEGQANDWETTVIRQYRFGYMHYLPDGRLLAAGIATILVSPTLAKALTPGDSISVRLVYRSEHKTGYNVVGIVSGTSPALAHQAVVVSAHLDHIGRIGAHIYNGANDDASGCVAELGAARLLAAHPGQRSAIFVFFCGEELNLKGSRWFADHLPLPKDDILVSINLEQLGSRHRTSPGVWALGDPQFQAAFYKAGDNSPAHFSAEELPFSATDSVREVLSNTDTYSFMKKDIPSLLLGSGGFSEHHMPLDKIDLIDFHHLQKAADLLWQLINILTN